MPCSETISFVSSSEFFSINSLNLNITLALCNDGFIDHSSNAFFAISTALSKSDFGPLSSKPHYEKVLGYIDSGEKEGAKLLADGRNFKKQGYENGYFVGPTIFDEVKPNMKIYKEEIFGPVLSMMTTGTYEEALNLVNDHELGNGAAVFTKSGNIAKHFTENANIGMIGVNVPIPVPVAYHSFGGWKRSLFGDHSIHGPDGVRFYTKLKTATVTWVEDNAGPEFTIPVLS